ncbi:SET domain and Histone-lysine N-methyltransferase, Suvar4-20 family-containing protein [Strongyloides ratti]|uniref:[histone H4]-N-methyl-L-lysine(20) N-methyltransferase n=1 Tax=Strongyloides ratti TaxID=34506 RepID=A0A090KXZ8_STRRB|nr:SET domain and Histone-lysine N-methyltransferase, Suvar4-20 family-containing protein [Strongyloides ratti]CEF62291.1 SET domain and Histone-lysine N-methyltransferase, Suvar4-20 family-containing protein [Strongyloides ratti]
MNNEEWGLKVMKLCSSSAIPEVPPIGHHMSLDDFMAFDDVANCIVIDVLLGIRSHKMRPKKVFLTKEENISCYKLLREYLENFNVVKTLQNIFLLTSMRNFCLKMDGKQLIELRNHVHRYLMLFQPASGISIQKCFKYSKEKFLGAKLVATRKFKSNEQINMLYGVVKPLTKEQINKVIKSGINDFSIMISDRTEKQILWLGPGSFLNHDCNSNVRFDCRGIHTVVLIATKDIDIGEELYLNYGDNYFGDNNKECQCESCEKIKNEKENLLKWTPIMCKEIDENIVDCLELISLRNEILKKIYDFQISKNNLIISLNYIVEFLKYGFINDGISKISSSQNFIKHELEYLSNVKYLLSLDYDIDFIKIFTYLYKTFGICTSQGKVGTPTTKSIILQRNEAIFKYSFYEAIFGPDIAEALVQFQCKLFEQYHYEKVSIGQIISVLQNFINILRRKDFNKVFQDKINIQNERIKKIEKHGFTAEFLFNTFDIKIDILGNEIIEKERKYIERNIEVYEEKIQEKLKNCLSFNFVLSLMKDKNNSEAIIGDLKTILEVNEHDVKVQILNNKIKGFEKIKAPLNIMIETFDNKDNNALLISMYNDELEEITRKYKKSQLIKTIDIDNYVLLDENKPKTVRSSIRLKKDFSKYENYNIEPFLMKFYCNSTMEKILENRKRTYELVNQDFEDVFINQGRLKHERKILEEISK